MWLIPFSEDIIQWVAENNLLDRIFAKTYKFLPGDEVFAYITEPYKRVMYRFIVTDTDVTLANALESAGLWISDDFDAEKAEKSIVVRMELQNTYDSAEFDDKLSYQNLNDNGMGCVMFYQSIVGEKRNILKSLTKFG